MGKIAKTVFSKENAAILLISRSEVWMEIERTVSVIISPLAT